MSEKTIHIPDEQDFSAKITNGGYLYMVQSYRDICLSPHNALTLGQWLVATFGAPVGAGAGG